jgi:putative transposase
MEKRSFTKEKKLAILKEASSNGVTATLEKAGIYPATYYCWLKKFVTMGEAGFCHGMTPTHMKEIKRLEKENKILKELLAEKELEGRLKDGALKKEYTWALLSRLKNSRYI